MARCEPTTHRLVREVVLPPLQQRRTCRPEPPLAALTVTALTTLGSTEHSQGPPNCTGGRSTPHAFPRTFLGFPWVFDLDWQEGAPREAGKPESTTVGTSIGFRHGTWRCAVGPGRHFPSDALS